jgi:hypothetical protein
LKLTAILSSLILGCLLFTIGCNGGDDDGGASDEDLRQALPTMVLQSEEIPAGLHSLGTSFADNEQASGGVGGGATKEQLDAWGRILGYSSDYQAGDPKPEAFTTALSSQVTLYEDASGASQSLQDRVARARTADWQASHSDLQEFMKEEPAMTLPVNEYYWFRLSGFQPTSPTETRLVSDDIIVFRDDRAWSYLNVVSMADPGETDRAFAQNTVANLILKQAENTRSALDSGILD